MNHSHFDSSVYAYHTSFTAMGPPLGGPRGRAYRANVILHYNINKPLWLSKVKHVFGKAFICNTASNKKCFIKVYMKTEEKNKVTMGRKWNNKWGKKRQI